jgi:phosphopantothenoylcysteine decarboxylase/phosphopantothenate--cysteine ligase
LACAAPLAIAPAMNQQMYKNIATQNNLSTLISRNVHIFGPAAGAQACGDVGLGRMLEPLEIVAAVESLFAQQAASTAKTQLLAGCRVVITAGPTREAIDPVRFISNHSSGKMGFAIAQAASELGASVTLISGPVQLATPAGVRRIDVITAQDMYQAALGEAVSHDIFIGCAAVADYRVEHIAEQKIKKTDDSDAMQLRLVKNPDIIASVAALTSNRPFTVGFAAETQQVEQYARAKLAKKNLDLICANDVSVPDQGFNADQNTLTVYSATQEFPLGLQSKAALSHALISLIYEQYHHEKSH